MVGARLSAPLLDEKDIFRVVGHTIGDPTIWMVSDCNRRETSHPRRAKRGGTGGD